MKRVNWLSLILTLCFILLAILHVPSPDINAQTVTNKASQFSCEHFHTESLAAMKTADARDTRQSDSHYYQTLTAKFYAKSAAKSGIYLSCLNRQSLGLVRPID